MKRKFYKPLARFLVEMNRQGLLDFDWEWRYFQIAEIVENMSYKNVGRFLLRVTPAEQEAAYADLTANYSLKGRTVSCELSRVSLSPELFRVSGNMTAEQTRGTWGYQTPEDC